MPKKTASVPSPGRPGGAGTDPDVLGLGVHLMTTERGRALVLPRSLARLDSSVLEVLADIQDVARRRDDLDEQLREMVAHAREHGASWAAVAWSVGMTSEGARLRYRDDPVTDDRGQLAALDGYVPRNR